MTIESASGPPPFLSTPELIREGGQSGAANTDCYLVLGADVLSRTPLIPDVGAALDTAKERARGDGQGRVVVQLIAAVGIDPVPAVKVTHFRAVAAVEAHGAQW